MSKAARSRSKLKRKKEKAARKAAKKALYLKYAEAGRTKRSFRFKRKQRRLVGERGSHTIKCGNPACRKCYDTYLHYKKN